MTTASGKTKTFVVSTTPVAVTAQSYCGAIMVREDAGVSNWPTTAFKIAKPTSSDTPITFATGEAYTFTRSNSNNPNAFLPGEIVGYVFLPSGSTTFSQDER